MKDKIFLIFMYTIGIIQGIFLLLFALGICIKISHQQDYNSSDREVFFLEILVAFILILLGFNIWGLIKRYPILIFVPTALIILCLIIRLFSVGLGSGLSNQTFFRRTWANCSHYYHFQIMRLLRILRFHFLNNDAHNAYFSFLSLVISIL